MMKNKVHEPIPWSDLFKQFHFLESSKADLERLELASGSGRWSFDTQPDSSIVLLGRIEPVAA